jgi:hypothetical protein
VRPLSEFKANVKEFDDVHDLLAQAMAEKGHFVAPPAVIRHYGRWAAIIVVCVWFQLAWNYGAKAPVYAAGLVTALIVWFMARWLSRRLLTVSGRRARTQLLGFRQFLHRAEKARLDRMPPDTLHKLLPWAIALGVTDAWLGRFVGRTVAPNEWYVAPKPLGLAQLGGEIKQMHTLLRPRR